LNLPGHTLAVEGIASEKHRLGALALAMAEDAPAENAIMVSTLLTTCARHLALRLLLEAQEKACRASQDDRAALVWLAERGEMASPLAHEVNNLLNVLFLQLALLEQDLPNSRRPQLSEISRQGRNVAALVRQWQEYRGPGQPAPQPVSLNRVVCEEVEALRRRPAEAAPPLEVIRSDAAGSAGLTAPRAVRLSLTLAADLPPVLGWAPDLRRLCTFLLSHAAAAVGPGGIVTVRTERSAGPVLLRVEDSGPWVPPELLPKLLEPHSDGRPGTNRLELAACKPLVRRLQGKLRAENRAEGGMAFSVELAAAPEQPEATIGP
jgi:signal transduction histidine kinase